jgi:hypothetical protein
MHNVEAVGIEKAVSRLREFGSQLNADNWQLAPLLARAAAQGSSLASLLDD